MSDENNAPPRAKIASALSKAQAAYKPLRKSRTVKVKTKAGYEYTFDYADLSDIFEATREALAKNALATVQILKGNSLETRLLHDSGEEFVSVVEVPRGNDMKDYGSNITYMRRYALGPLLGIASEEDDDGNGGKAEDLQTKPPRTQAPTPTPAAPPPARAPDTTPDWKVISPEQLTRFWAITTEAGWHTDDLKAYLKMEYNLESTRAIPVAKYDQIVAHIQRNPVKK